MHQKVIVCVATNIKKRSLSRHLRTAAACQSCRSTTVVFPLGSWGVSLDIEVERTSSTESVGGHTPQERSNLPERPAHLRPPSSQHVNQRISCTHLDVASGAFADHVLAGDGLPGHVYPRARSLQVVGVGVNLADGLRDGAVLYRADRRGGEHRGEEEEVSRGNRGDLKLAGVDLFQERVRRPARTQNDHLLGQFMFSGPSGR